MRQDFLTVLASWLPREQVVFCLLTRPAPVHLQETVNRGRTLLESEIRDEETSRGAVTPLRRAPHPPRQRLWRLRMLAMPTKEGTGVLARNG